MLKRAKVWNAISEDVKALPEQQGAVAMVLPPDLKRKLFETAASRPEWLVAHYLSKYFDTIPHSELLSVWLGGSSISMCCIWFGCG